MGLLFYGVRVGGIELPSSAWKAEILPLNYTRVWINVDRMCIKIYLSTLTYPNTFIFQRCLILLSYKKLFTRVGMAGLEPATARSQTECPSQLGHIPCHKITSSSTLILLFFVKGSKKTAITST